MYIIIKFLKCQNIVGQKRKQFHERNPEETTVNRNKPKSSRYWNLLNTDKKTIAHFVCYIKINKDNFKNTIENKIKS
jgi:hypothetical protein